MTKQQTIQTLHKRLESYIRIDKRGTDLTGTPLTRECRIVVNTHIAELINVLDLLGLEIDLDLYYKEASEQTPFDMHGGTL